MFCNKCGKQLEEGARFCPGCGAPVVGAGQETVVKENPVQENNVQPAPINEEDYTTVSHPDISDDITEYNEFEEAPKKGVAKTIILISLITFLVALLAVGGFLFYNGTLTKFFGINMNKAASEDDDSYGGKGKKKNSVSDFDDDDGNDNPGGSNPEAGTQTVASEPKKGSVDVDLLIRQVDNSNFPEVVFYAGVYDKDGNSVSNLKKEDFEVTEIDSRGNVSTVPINKVDQVIASNERISMQLVLDASSSMNSYDKLDKSKYAAKALVNKLGSRVSDKVSIIKFDDYVYLEQDFTQDRNTLNNAIDNIYAYGNTALYDGIYAGITQTYYEDGVKCVIALTDGAENASSYSFDDVINLAKQTGVPVYIIGIGDYSYDNSDLIEMAKQCSGKYFSAEEQELDTILEEIYIGIYEEQQDYYTFSYTSPNMDDMKNYRTIKLSTSPESIYRGVYEKEYVPESDVSGAFSDSYADLDFMLDFSSDREVTEADLSGMSLAQLRIARNEIFARHGRQFADAFLNQWFYSKTWYLSIPQKYSPDYFTANNPNPLSKLEIKNVDFIKAYEDRKMEYEDIFPYACDVKLSEYDLNLSKENLKRALSQVQRYSRTAIRDENIRLIEEAIDRDDIEY